MVGLVEPLRLDQTWRGYLLLCLTKQASRDPCNFTQVWYGNSLDFRRRVAAFCFVRDLYFKIKTALTVPLGYLEI